VQALRIGAVENSEAINEQMARWMEMSAPELIVGSDRKCVMSLIGWAREGDDPSLVLSLVSRAGTGQWLEHFLDGVLAPEAVDDPTVARLLTHKEALDLRWLLGYVQEADRNEDSESRIRPARRRWRKPPTAESEQDHG
jgi:hypothetical protein